MEILRRDGSKALRNDSPLKRSGESPSTAKKTRSFLQRSSDKHVDGKVTKESSQQALPQSPQAPKQEEQQPPLDSATLAKEFERKHYKDMLRILLKSRCCTPSDLSNLQQLRIRLNIDEETHHKIINELGWSWEALVMSARRAPLHYVYYLSALLIRGYITEEELSIVQYLQQKYDIDDEKHAAALDQSGFTVRDYNLAIVKGMEQLGEHLFGENREYVIKTVPSDHTDYDRLHGYITEPHLRQWVEGGDDNVKTLYREKDARRVSWEELFYDLLYVGIMQQLAHGFAHDLSKWFDFLVLFCSLWTIYIHSISYIARFDSRDLIHKHIFYFAQSIALVSLALSIPETYEESGGRAFGVSYIVSLVCVIVMYCWVEYCQLFGYDARQTKYPGKKIRQQPIIYITILTLSVIPWLISVIYGKYWYWFWIPSIFMTHLLDAWHGVVLYSPLTIEHWIERIGLYSIIVFGEVVITLIAFDSYPFDWDSFVLGILGLALTFAIKIIYFDIQGAKKKLHALYRNRFTAYFWTYSHLVFSFSLASICVGISGIQKTLRTTNTTTISHKKRFEEFESASLVPPTDNSTHNTTTADDKVKANYDFVLYFGTPRPENILAISLAMCLFVLAFQIYISLEHRRYIFSRKHNCGVLLFGAANLMYISFLPGLYGILLLGICTIIVGIVLIILTAGRYSVRDRPIVGTYEDAHLEFEAERRVSRLSQAHDSITIGEARRLSQLFDSSMERNSSGPPAECRRGTLTGERPHVTGSHGEQHEGGGVEVRAGDEAVGETQGIKPKDIEPGLAA